jgi:hypothetical protein
MGKIKNLLLIFSFLPLLLFKASASQYANDTLVLSEYNYRTFIKPQMKNVLSDFYGLLGSMHALNPFIVRIKSDLIDIQTYYRKWTIGCLEIRDDECLEFLKSMQTKLFSIDELIQRIRSKPEILMDDQTEFDLKVFRLRSDLAGFEKEILQFTDYLTEEIILYNTILVKYTKPHIVFQESLDRVNLYYGKLLFALVRDIHREEFILLFHAFISPLEKYLVAEDRPEILLQNMESFNFSLNHFGRTLLFGSESLQNSDQQSLIKQLQNHWNVILKLVLNQ